MENLAALATAGGKTNVAFVASFLSGNVEACVDLLIATKRLPEAAFFVRTYLPSRIDEIVTLWKEDLATVSESAAKALAKPSENPTLFPDIDIGIQVEKMFLAQRDQSKITGIPASDYLTAKDDLELNLIALIKGKSQPQAPPVPMDVDEVANDDGEADRIAAEEAAAEEAAVEEAAALAAAEEARRREEEDLAAAAAAEEAAAAEAAKEDDFAEDW
jgi:coatomer subunit beta'